MGNALAAAGFTTAGMPAGLACPPLPASMRASQPCGRADLAWRAQPDGCRLISLIPKMILVTYKVDARPRPARRFSQAEGSGSQRGRGEVTFLYRSFLRAQDPEEP